MKKLTIIILGILALAACSAQLADDLIYPEGGPPLRAAIEVLAPPCRHHDELMGEFFTSSLLDHIIFQKKYPVGGPSCITVYKAYLVVTDSPDDDTTLSFALTTAE